METTTEEEFDADYMSLVEADKRSILEQILTYDYESLSRGAVPSTDAEKNTKDKKDTDAEEDTNAKTDTKKTFDESNVKQTLQEEYDKIFGDIDIDDSEEIFNNILKKVEEEFKRQMELKKNNPFLAASLSAATEVDLEPKRKAKKRKPKAFEQSLKVMDNFKKQLLENAPGSDKLRSSSSNSTGSSSALVKSSKNTCALVRSQRPSGILKSSLKFYPKWKTTNTYTPIFSAPSNPNWASIPTTIEQKQLEQKTASKSKMSAFTPRLMPTGNVLGLPKTMNLSKMYTSTEIRNWIPARQETDNSFNWNKVKKDDYHKAEDDDFNKAANAQLLSSSNRTFRSDQSVCNSELNNGVFESPMKSPLYSSTPVRNTVVRFRPSPPECFLFSSDGNSTVSSDSSVIDYENNAGEGNDVTTYECLSEGLVYYENSVNEQTTSRYFNEDYSGSLDVPDSPCSNCPENYYPMKQPANHQEPKFNYFNVGYNCCNGHQPCNNEKRALHSSNSLPPIPSEDFVRNLRYSININYNIINNYN